MQRIGDLIPSAAAHLGLGDELRRARAVATFDAIVAPDWPPVASTSIMHGRSPSPSIPPTA